MRFIDGTQGEVDMTEILTGESPGVFVALRDPGFFTDAMRASFEAVMERGLREQTRFFFLAWSVLLAAIIGVVRTELARKTVHHRRDPAPRSGGAGVLQ